jgi:hypothetical protein
MTAQSIKRFIFRHGRLGMGDTQEIITRVRSRLDEMDARLLKKYQIVVAPPSDAELKERIAAFRGERLDSFFELVHEETGAQWDRIIDRRISNTLWTLISVVIGFVLGRL